MGIIKTKITLSNPRLPELLAIETEALVDTGAIHLCIPQKYAMQLQLDEQEKRPAVFANGNREVCSYVGPVKVQWNNRTSYTGAMVLGDEVLLGAIPIEDMDLIIHPAQLRLTVNPESPNFPTTVVK